MMTDKYENIDLDLEKLVFLNNAEEGNPGIYELTWELGYYNLTIEDKYKIAHELLSSLLADGLIILDKYTDSTLENKVETIVDNKTEEVLNNPSFWYPCNEIISITLTQKGKNYLDDNVPKYGDKFADRFKEKTK
jgi:hypothetical protein